MQSVLLAGVPSEKEILSVSLKKVLATSVCTSLHIKSDFYFISVLDWVSHC